MKINHFNYNTNHSVCSSSFNKHFIVEVVEENIHNQNSMLYKTEEIINKNIKKSLKEIVTEIERSFLFEGYDGFMNLSFLSLHKDECHFLNYGSHELFLFRNDTYELISRNKKNRLPFGGFEPESKNVIFDLKSKDRLILCSKSVYDNFTLKELMKIFNQKESVRNIKNTLDTFKIQEGYSLIIINVL